MPNGILVESTDPWASLDIATRLQGLAAWADTLTPRTPGRWGGGERSADGVITMPYFDYDADASRFISDMYRLGWVQPFDWGAWAASDDGRALLDDPTAVAKADADDLVRLMTAILRGDRFNEGLIADFWAKGHLAAIARRAEALAP
jgi:hypothetical protein